MRLLDSAAPEWSDIAAAAAHDAAFSHGILTAKPGDRAEHGEELVPRLTRRLELIGPDLLRAWLLQMGSYGRGGSLHEQIISHSLLAAECALHLAIETSFPRPAEAYQAGLWHDLGRLAMLASIADYPAFASGYADESAMPGEERKRFGQTHAAVSARLAASAGAVPTVVDAIALHHALEEQAAVAHPLARIVWVAEALASPQYQANLAAASRVSGLGEDTLLSLRTDVSYLASGNLRELGIGETPGGGALDGMLPAPEISFPAHRTQQDTGLVTRDYWRSAAIQGLLRSAFSAIPGELAVQRLEIASRLLFGRPAPLMTKVMEDGSITAIPGMCEPEFGLCFDELGLRLDDEASVLSLAARTGSATSHFPGANGPGRSPRDWHLARWLQSPGLLCLPCSTPDGERYVAVYSIDESLDAAPADQALMTALAASAAQVLTAEREGEQQRAQLRSELSQQYKEHARRVVHEINNPLTIIRSYLGVLGQRMDSSTTLHGELSILNKELDRVSSLLKGIGEPPGEVSEVPRCNISEVLHELRSLYADALFTHRGIELDLRAGSGLPLVRIPGSVLKQVLLNLFRNASEAMGAGGKLSVSTAGILVADGVPCLEIRLIDNGPGIPAERLTSLFVAQPSEKSGHQGVGMSISKDLLQRWKSSIVCRSQPGSGTSFQIFLPLD
jgi:signal transduction histidine kinase/HD superfamily phosphohydrolase YqeK